MNDDLIIDWAIGSLIPWYPSILKSSFLDPQILSGRTDATWFDRYNRGEERVEYDASPVSQSRAYLNRL
jgi:hypothetical protein